MNVHMNDKTKEHTFTEQELWIQPYSHHQLLAQPYTALHRFLTWIIVTALQCTRKKNVKLKLESLQLNATTLCGTSRNCAQPLPPTDAHNQPVALLLILLILLITDAVSASSHCTQ